MLATENTVVARLNLAARAAFLARGEVSRHGHVGDRARLGDNDGHLLQPDGARAQVRNGMEGRPAPAVVNRVLTLLGDPVAALRSWDVARV